MEKQRFTLTLPVQLVEIGRFTVSNDGKTAIIYGNLAPREEKKTDADFFCITYFVRIDDEYSVFKTLEETINFIWETQSENNYGQD